MSSKIRYASSNQIKTDFKIRKTQFYKQPITANPKTPKVLNLELNIGIINNANPNPSKNKTPKVM